MSAATKALRWSVPFCYLFHSRLRARQDRVSWLFVHPVPVLYLALVWPDGGEVMSSAGIALLGLLAFQTIYEIGYIQNDVFTVKRELHPTLRLTPGEAKEVELAYPVVVMLRLATFALLTFGAFVLMPDACLVEFVGTSILALVVFALHNAVRSRWNVLTYFLLASCRYAAVPVLIHGLDVAVMASVLMMMPIVRTIEHSCKPKYGFNSIRGLVTPFARFRPVYYILALGTWALFVAWLNAPSLPGLVFVYFLAYRSAIFIVVRRGVVAPTRHDAYVDPKEGEG